MFRRLERSLNGVVDWETFKDRMKKEYMPFNQEMEFRKKLGKLRQGSGTFKEYLYNFNILLNQLDNVTELDQIYHFQNGLNDETADKVAEERPTTLERAIDIAAAHEQKFDNRRNRRSNDYPNGFRKWSERRVEPTTTRDYRNGAKRMSTTPAEKKI